MHMAVERAAWKAGCSAERSDVQRVVTSELSSVAGSVVRSDGSSAVRSVATWEVLVVAVWAAGSAVPMVALSVPLEAAERAAAMAAHSAVQ